MTSCTDKKEYKIFLIYKEISDGIGCKVIYEEGLPIIWGRSKYFTIYEEAVSHIWLCAWSPWISLYRRKILFYFLSVCWLHFLLFSKPNTYSVCLPSPWVPVKQCKAFSFTFFQKKNVQIWKFFKLRYLVYYRRMQMAETEQTTWNLANIGKHLIWKIQGKKSYL